MCVVRKHILLNTNRHINACIQIVWNWKWMRWHHYIRIFEHLAQLLLAYITATNVIFMRSILPYNFRFVCSRYNIMMSLFCHSRQWLNFVGNFRALRAYQKVSLISLAVQWHAVVTKKLKPFKFVRSFPSNIM